MTEGTMTDCIFCKIATGEMDADIVYHDDHVVAFRDINPQAPTHVQVIPRTHVAKMSEFDPEEDSTWLVALFAAAKQIAASEGLEDGYRLVFNDGPLAGQSVLHVHLHVLGGRQMRWPPG